MNKTTTGFTIVELLITIAVIAILASISVVAYNNIQQRARDAKRTQDIAQIVKALELYYVENGQYPTGSGAVVPNPAWSSSATPASWQHLMNQLAPYASHLPTDPVNTDAGNFAYTYYSNLGVVRYCGASGTRQMYILRYRLESGEAKHVAAGDCSTEVLSYEAPWSWHRAVK